MIEPPPVARMNGMTLRESAIIERAFCWNTSSMIASSASASGTLRTKPPALLTSTSIRPKRSWASTASRARLALSLASAAKASASPPPSRMRATSACASARFER